MQYIKIDNNTWVEINGESTRLVRKSEILDEIAFNQDQLVKLPIALTDQQKITWYNENMNEEENKQSRSLINAVIESLQQKLSMLV